MPKEVRYTGPRGGCSCGGSFPKGFPQRPFPASHRRERGLRAGRTLLRGEAGENTLRLSYATMGPEGIVGVRRLAKALKRLLALA
ncbi:hypothetical protein [Thermus tengchongensis]|uniref:hypothetical protein n=1 Tax=Thermus tengchongensis TaxID=1214928 RepID=UPI000B0E3193|nr:hypothetical protein [Thermus tengchongensis]